jgi:shikimate kinase
MAGIFRSHGRRFTIDGAFEEENDEAICVYVSTTGRLPMKPKNRNMISEDSIVVYIKDPIRSASTSTASRLKTSDDVGFMLFNFMNVQEQCVHSLHMTFF